MVDRNTSPPARSSPPQLPMSTAPTVPAAVDEAEALALPLTVEEPNSLNDDPDRHGMDTIEQRGITFETEPGDSRSFGGDIMSSNTGGGTYKPTLPSDRMPVISSIPIRPPIRRDSSTPLPAPQHLPPPAPPIPPAPADGGDGAPGGTDSLSLMQLRRLVTEMPRVEPTPYAFTYADVAPFRDELDEWFTYRQEELDDILEARDVFRDEWARFRGVGGKTAESADAAAEDEDFTTAPAEAREEFVRGLIARVRGEEPGARRRVLFALVYLGLGCWYHTAGVEDEEKAEGERSDEQPADGGNEAKLPKAQISWMQSNARLISSLDGLQPIYDVLREVCLLACEASSDDQEAQELRDANRQDVWCAMTMVYVLLESARVDEDEQQRLRMRGAFCNLTPSPLIFMLDVITKIRWDENIPIQLSKVLLLVWKLVLVCFGGLEEVQAAKASFKDPELEETDKHGQPLITASPLDYHSFRQEISSKYPAYNPPPPLFPLEPENNSILPPLKNHPNKVAGSNVFGSSISTLNGNGTSIVHQPVHIATPAPSPPPSPAGPGGKGGKKQNYQTNQLFPFLYPPLDESSNNLGGKGSTDLQDLLVSRKWTGSDIPTSILEAAELFATRMRATRAMKQLWQERILFMKYERGWIGPGENNDVENLDLSEAKEDGSNTQPAAENKETFKPGSVEERMQMVEDFYRDALPHLQSLVIVLIRVVLNHVTTLVTQAHGSNGLQSGFQYQENMNGNSSAIHEQSNGGMNGLHPEDLPPAEDLELVRTQEILDKALSGILILLLKWFKVSHILKFEYLTQLLVDSSYIPLILKFYQCQEIERVVNFRSDREDLNFFNFCSSRSLRGEAQAQAQQAAAAANAEAAADSDSDDAVPPPIKRHRDDPPSQELPSDSYNTPHQSQQPPQLLEVDELGFPTSELPSEPITTFSWRVFFSAINLLRIMQKMCKHKAHRNLMLVSYKSSTCLRKALKVPQPELRLYTLKLFKNQVPYCGRKWRSSNMRVITAVYLHCRPELRDDWLAGADVDADVDESVPLEQALRALTHWWNLRNYPAAMGASPAALVEEQDFFRRELEKMEWWGTSASSSSGGGGGGGASASSASEDGGPVGGGHSSNASFHAASSSYAEPLQPSAMPPPQPPLHQYNPPSSVSAIRSSPREFPTGLPSPVPHGPSGIIDEGGPPPAPLLPTERGEPSSPGLGVWGDPYNHSGSGSGGGAGPSVEWAGRFVS